LEYRKSIELKIILEKMYLKVNKDFKKLKNNNYKIQQNKL